MLKDEVQSATNYFSIIRVIADGNHKLGRLAGALGLESSALTPYLSTLIELGFLVKDTPITEKIPEKSRKGLYFIADNFGAVLVPICLPLQRGNWNWITSRSFWMN